MSRPGRRSSIAGLVAARVLAGHAERVVVIEDDKEMHHAGAVFARPEVSRQRQDMDRLLPATLVPSRDEHRIIR